MDNLQAPQPNSKSTQEDLKLAGVEQQLKYPLDYVSQEIIRQFVATIVPQSFPVGSIFMAVVDTNPATLLGYGTWTAWGSGRIPVGVDTGDTDFDTVEETGGSKAHTLSDAELPAHQFNVLGSSPGAWGLTAGSSYGTVTGSATAFDIMNPYITCYFWKRTN